MTKKKKKKEVVVVVVVETIKDVGEQEVVGLGAADSHRRLLLPRQTLLRHPNHLKFHPR
jgi:hypothetical protein